MPNFSSNEVQLLTAVIGGVAVIIGALITVVLQRSHESHAGPIHLAPAAVPVPEKQNRLETVLSTHAIRVGAVKHPPLSNFEWENGIPRFGGWYVKLCEIVCKENGLHPYFIPVEWGDIPDRAFDEMGLDIVLSVFATGQRSEKADFTSCFHSVDVTGITRADNARVRNIADLAKEDVRIVVTRGEAGYEYVFNDLRTPKHRVIVVDTFDITEMLDYVLDGKVDVAICDKVSCYDYAQAHPEIQTVFFEEHIYTCRNCIMVPKNEPQLKEWVQREFGKARKVREIDDAEQVILSDPRKLIRRYA